MSHLLRRIHFQRHLSIRWKLVLPFLLITALVLVILLPTATNLVSRRIQDEADRQLSQAAESVAALLEDSEAQALLSANFVANLPEVDQAHEDLEFLTGVLAERKEQLGLQELSFYGPDFQPGELPLIYGGPVVARRFQASEQTIQIRDELVARVLSTGQAASGIVIAPQSSQIIGAAPVRAMGANTEVEGVILAVFFVDDLFVTEISDILDTDVAIVADNAVIVSTIDQESGYELLLQQGFVDPAGNVTARNISYGDGRQFRLLALPLVLDDRPEATVLVTQPLSDLFQVNRDIQAVLFIFAGAVILVSLVVLAAFLVTFGRPLARLAEATTQISQGNFSQRVEASYFLLKDEITDLSENFNNMAQHLQNLYASLEQRVQDRTRELVEEHQKLETALQELAVARDEAVAANQAKSEFVSVVTHELKSPLTAIQGYIDLLKMGAAGPTSEEQINFLNTIRSNADRMARLVSDLADISRIESGHLRLEYEAVSLVEVVADVVKSIGSQLEEKQQKLTLALPDNLPRVWCDCYRLLQVMSNLISNAHKYTPPGGEITVYAEPATLRWAEDGRSRALLVAVRDTGIGINSEDQERIFQKFFRASDEQARLAPGTGLGLSITKNLVEMQGGYICFESEYRRGTTFYFTLPLAPPSPEPAATMVEANEA
ncbi:MAG: ATP-binding protein [Chloroflexi bacterium]|nr:ATP-binding protein [Chloroflexota bacterium]MCI0576076.1 ATP-binding protein [Chloroflexota bacterium]MCI0647864.1 ATP-binding protein [Chloroflexota bacterium]MCI0727115.1 ATP-binding protein [Chloroflexota bacterium]